MARGQGAVLRRSWFRLHRCRARDFGRARRTKPMGTMMRAARSWIVPPRWRAVPRRARRRRRLTLQRQVTRAFGEPVARRCAHRCPRLRQRPPRRPLRCPQEAAALRLLRRRRQLLRRRAQAVFETSAPTTGVRTQCGGRARATRYRKLPPARVPGRDRRSAPPRRAQICRTATRVRSALREACLRPRRRRSAVRRRRPRVRRVRAPKR